MTHPMAQAARTESVQNGTITDTHTVQNARFLPVLVYNEDQEAIHAAQGYEPQGHSDPSAFARMVTIATNSDPNYEPQEYPKWVGARIANNADEERTIRMEMGETNLPEALLAPAVAEPEPTCEQLLAQIREMRNLLLDMPAVDQVDAGTDQEYKSEGENTLPKRRGRPPKAE